MKQEIACFVSPHGFGHATRTIAVLEELFKIIPNIHIHFISTIPQSLVVRTDLPVTVHPVSVDVGLIQNSAFGIDQQRTAAALKNFLPFRQELLDRCTKICRTSQLIICDISALGIAVAKRLEVPSILIENFTWNWIYDSNYPELCQFSTLLKDQYVKADYHLQAEPVCRKVPNTLTCQPIARHPRATIESTKRSINCNDKKVILITMGGFPLELPFVKQLSDYPHCHFILAGQQEYRLLEENILLLPYESQLYHPDLIMASDLVVCKSGYSTIAECVQSTTSICAVSRSDFAESAVLEHFVRTHLDGVIITQEEFSSGAWLAHLPHLLMRSRKPSPASGAEEAAQFIAALL